MSGIDGSRRLKCQRGKYHGIIQILRYNRDFYLASLAAAAVVFLAALWMPPMLRTVGITGALTTGAWILVSLLVSHWVYDRSLLYSLDWLALEPKVWLNVHAGLDEMTDLLRARLPFSEYRVFDIFDAVQMTEPSLARARQLSGSKDSQQVSWRSLPMENASVDAIFLVFAAHEFRNREPRHLFFRELRRILRPGSALILVEHLRDLPNFLAYGPGSMHFQSRRTWMDAFAAAQLEIRHERKITPFVSLFELTAGG
jgi:SAM-dependent methyltransferase